MDYLQALIESTQINKNTNYQFMSQRYKNIALFQIYGSKHDSLIMKINPRKAKDLDIKNKIVKAKKIKRKQINWLYVNTINAFSRTPVQFDTVKQTITFLKDYKQEDEDLFPHFKKGTVIEYGKNYLKRIK